MIMRLAEKPQRGQEKHISHKKRRTIREKDERSEVSKLRSIRDLDDLRVFEDGAAYPRRK